MNKLDNVSKLLDLDKSTFINELQDNIQILRESKPLP